MSSKTPLGLLALGLLSTACTPAAQSFQLQLANVTPYAYAKSGTFNTAVGASAPGPITSGHQYEVTFTAGKGQKLSFAVMFGQSDDWFFAPAPEGIALYDSAGNPTTGDVTSQIHLYNAGTEIDEEPGVGPDTGPKQSSPTQGAPDPDPTVREIAIPTILSDGSSFNTPATNAMIAVSLSTTGNPCEFKLTVANVSTASTLQTSQGPIPVGISPGVFVIHTSPNALFTLGQADRGQGLENIAEAGNITVLAPAVAAKAGLLTGFSPLVYVLHSSGNPIFTEGQPDRGQGLENIAESGNIVPLHDYLTAHLPEGAEMVGSVNTADGASAAGPIAAGQQFTFHISATPDERISFASMLGASDDWFAGVSDSGLALFDAHQKPISGDQSAALQLWNAGTEVDEEPGVGADTGPNQSTPDQGAPDPIDQVRKLEASLYNVPASTHLKFTVTPE